MLRSNISLLCRVAFEIILYIREVHRVPEEDDVLALVVGKGDVLELAVDDSGKGEFGSGLLNLSD